MIEYVTTTDGLRASQLEGFFVGWPMRPTPARHLELLRGSERVVLARDSESGQIVGFVSAVGDGVVSAFIPFLEVLPAYQLRGIGTELVQRILEQLGGRYLVDLVCDEELVPFYERFGMSRGVAMIIRNRSALAD